MKKKFSLKINKIKNFSMKKQRQNFSMKRKKKKIKL